MAVRQTKRISELTALTSASLDTTVVGVDNGVTYKIELDTLADAVTSRVNILDRSRLSSLESSTSSFESKGRSVISSSAQITSLGFVSSSTDITSLNSFTASQQSLNTAFNNGISSRLTTSSFESFSSSVHSEIIAATNEQSFNGLISGSSQLTSSYDERYVLSGSITQTTWDNIASKPNDIISSSAQITTFGFVTSSITTGTPLDYIYLKYSSSVTIPNSGSYIKPDGNVFGNVLYDSSTGYFSLAGSSTYILEANTKLSINGNSLSLVWFDINNNIDIPAGNAFWNDSEDQQIVKAIITTSTSTQVGLRVSYKSGISEIDYGRSYIFIQKSSLGSGSLGVSSYTDLTNLPIGLISGSSQLTSSYDARYTLSGSVQPLPNGLISGSSQLTASYDSRYTLSGSITVSPNTISSSAQITSLGFISSSTPITSLNTYTASNDTKWSTLGGLTGSYLTSLSGSISSSNQLTTSFDTRYAASASYLTSLNGAISSSIQVLGGSGVISSSTQIDTLFNLDGVISGSAQITSLGFISSSTPITSINSFTSSYNTGSFTGSFTGSIRGNINVYQGNTIRLYNTAETGYAQLSFIDADDKLQLQRGIQPSADNYWDLGRPGRRVNVVYASTFSGSIAATNGVISGSSQLPNGLVSGSSQLTSSYDTRYAPSASYLTSLNGAISSSIQVLGGTGIISSSTQIDTLFNIDGLVSSSIQLTSSFETVGSGIVSGAAQLPTGLVSGSSQLTSSYDTRYTLSGSVQPLPSGVISSSAQLPSGLVSGSSQLTASFDTRYALSGSGGSIPGGTISGSSQLTASFDTRYLNTDGDGVISGSSQLTSSYDGRYTLTSSFNSFTASAQSVTTGSNSFNGTQTITGSLIVTTGSFVGSTITANTSSLYLTSGSNLYVQNNGYVEITGSLFATSITGAIAATNGIISGSSQLTSLATTGSNVFIGNQTITGSLTISGSTNTSIISPVLMVGTGSGDEGGEILLAKPITNTSITGSGITIDSYQNKIRIFEQGGDARGVSIDITKTPGGVGGELMWKVSNFVNAGTYVSLDNIKATLTSSGNRGLSIAAVSTTFTAMYAGTFNNTGGAGGNSSNGTVSITTTPTTSLFGWNFAGAGDLSTFVLTDTTNNRVYRITLQIGGGYSNNFIMIERLY